MILGESQILGQVVKVYLRAVSAARSLRVRAVPRRHSHRQARKIRNRSVTALPALALSHLTWRLRG